MPKREPQIDTEAIWRMLSDRLRQFIRSHVPSPADSEDILQSMFLRIHRKLGNLRQDDRLESWVFQIARNAIADHYRKSPHNSLEVDSLPAKRELLNSENLNTEVGECLAAFIEQLPENLRRAVTFYEREGISQKEIASRESISLSGAKSRIQRGRKMLKQMFETCCQLQFDRRGNVLQLDSNSVAGDAVGPCDCNSQQNPCEQRTNFNAKPPTQRRIASTPEGT